MSARELLDDARKIEMIEWLTTPPHLRGRDGVPGTMEELARKLGVTSRTLRNWKSDKQVRVAWEQEARAITGDPERKQRVLDEAYEIALDRESSKQAKMMDLWLRAVGAIAPPSAATDEPGGGKATSELTDAELEALIASEAAKLLQERRTSSTVAPDVA